MTGRDDDVLTLSTIHSAKGGEWDVVHVLALADGSVPSDLATGDVAEIEEERRLLYVAMTRAKDELDLIVPERSYIRNQFKTDDRYIYGSRSRFIPDSVRRLFECHRWHDRKSESDRVRSKTRSTDVAANLLRMWH